MKYHIDYFSTDRISGWVFDEKDSSKSLSIHLYVDDQLIDTFRADIPRQGLAKLSQSINHGFDYRIGTAATMPSSSIKLASADSQEFFWEAKAPNMLSQAQDSSASPTNKLAPAAFSWMKDRLRLGLKSTKQIAANPSVPSEFEVEFKRGYWHISEFSVDVQQDYLAVKGTVKSPSDYTGKTVFLLKDEKTKSVLYQQSIHGENNTRPSGFSLQFSVPDLSARLRQGIVLDVVDERTEEPIFLHGSRYYVEDEAPFPPGENIQRIAGNASLIGFRMVGYSTFNHLESILGEHLEASYSSYQRICDWGCGCGRLTRYLRTIPNAQVTGLDIDPGNIEWVARTFEDVDFQVIDPLPPTAFTDASFDLLIGISVFTHLTVPRQNQWLAELQRILTQQGIALVTINSNKAWLMNQPGNQKDLEQYIQQGVIDTFSNSQLNGVVKTEDEYVNTFHTHQYVRQHWSQYFEVIDIVEGGLGGYQDVVILRNH